MTKENIIADLDYASRLAKEGAETPLLGGPIGLMWGVLLTITFFMQWAILTQTIALPVQTLAYLWIGFAIIGGLGCAVLGSRIEKKTGANSAANRVESYVWIMFAGMMATLFIGVVLNILFQEGTARLFDLILIVGFAGQGLAYGVVAKMSKLKLLHAASFAGFAASALCFSFYGDVAIYLIGSVATLFTIIIPSLLLMKKAGGSNVQ